MRDPWKSFTRRIPIKASQAEIFECLSTGDGMNRWFLRDCAFLDANKNRRPSSEPSQAGDDYSFLWHGYSDEIKEEGKIIANNGVDHIGFTFTDDTEVNIWLKSYHDVTIVELTQSKIPQEEDPAKNLHVQCSVGWTFYLTNLKSIVEGGIDLRNRDVSLQDMISA